MELFFYSGEDFKKFDFKKEANKIKELCKGGRTIRALVPVYEYLQCLAKEEEGVDTVPYIMPVNKGHGDKWIEENFEFLVRQLKEKELPIYIGNVRWIEPFAGEGIRVIGDFGLNITNIYSHMAYKNLGMERGRSSLENTEKGLGAFPLMVTEHYFDAESITDRKGVKYKLAYDRLRHKTVILKENEVIDWNEVRNMAERGAENIRLYITQRTFDIVGK